MSEAVGVEEKTLFSEIRRLTELSWKLNSVVFGERPGKEQDTPPASDVIREARDLVDDANNRIETCLEKLVTIGK